MSRPSVELRARVERLVAELQGVSVTDEAAGRTWAVSGTPFAILSGDAIELRLDPAIAAAAARTPNTATTSRGPEWVRFAPAEFDGHALDRLEAWIGLAHRRARS